MTHGLGLATKYRACKPVVHPMSESRTQVIHVDWSRLKMDGKVDIVLWTDLGPRILKPTILYLIPQYSTHQTLKPPAGPSNDEPTCEFVWFTDSITCFKCMATHPSYACSRVRSWAKHLVQRKHRLHRSVAWLPNADLHAGLGTRFGWSTTITTLMLSRLPSRKQWSISASHTAPMSHGLWCLGVATSSSSSPVVERPSSGSWGGLPCSSMSSICRRSKTDCGCICSPHEGRCTHMLQGAARRGLESMNFI